MRQINHVDQKYAQNVVALNQLRDDQTKLLKTLDYVHTDPFIEQRARELGYMRLDEMRFVITNPEVLYGTDDYPKE